MTEDTVACRGSAADPSLTYGHPGRYRETLQEFTADATHEKSSGAAGKVVADFCRKEGPGHNGMYRVFDKDGMPYLSIGDGDSDGRETQSRRAALRSRILRGLHGPNPDGPPDRDLPHLLSGFCASAIFLCTLQGGRSRKGIDPLRSRPRIARDSFAAFASPAVRALPAGDLPPVGK